MTASTTSWTMNLDYLTFENFVIANIFAQFLVACYLICGVVDAEYPASVWVVGWIVYGVVGAINILVLLAIRHAREQDEDRLMRSEVYIPSRLKWLKDSVKKFCYYPPTLPYTRMAEVEKICKRYAAVEDLLRRYDAWEEKITKTEAIRDWDEKREFHRKWEFCWTLRSVLNYRKAALLRAAYAASKIPRSETDLREHVTAALSVEYFWVATSIQNLWDEGWEEFMGTGQIRWADYKTEQAVLYRKLQERYFARA